MNLKRHLKCQIIDESSGDILCGCGCGYILEEKIPTVKHSDSISSDAKERIKQSHHKQINNKYHDSGLGTSINNYDKLFNSAENTQIRIQFHRFAKLQKIIRYSKNSDQRISRLLQTTSHFVSKNNLSERIMDQCVQYIHEGEKSKILIGKKIKLVSITLVFLACKELGCVYDPKKDLEELELKNIVFGRYVLYLQDKLKINYDPILVQIALLETKLNELNLKPRIINQAKAILQYCNSKPMFTARHDKIWVCTAVCLAVKNDKDYKIYQFPRLTDILTIFDTSEPSIKKFRLHLRDMGILHVLNLNSNLKKNIANYRGNYLDGS